MKRLAAVVALFLAASACAPAAPVVPASEIDTDVAYLASWALGGRGAGTAGGDSAAAFLARRYLALGLHGAFREACGAASTCTRSFFQTFHGVDVSGHNVGAVVPGTDSVLRGSYVVIGAHFDHLGRSPQHAADPRLGIVVRPGADDNASGTAAVLAIARRLAARPARRSVMLVNFDAEEEGLYGSRVFVENLPVAKDSIAFMLNLDMVGRLRGRALLVDGTLANDPVRAVMDSAARAAGVRTGGALGIAGRSDHASFAYAGIPAVALFTGFHDDYHRVSDVASRVDGPGIGRVVDVVERAVRIADGMDIRETSARRR